MTEEEEIRQLKAQVQMLLKRIEELERRQSRAEKAAESKVNVHDAFVIWKRYAPFFKVQFGRMKISAMSMEYWQSGFMQNGTDRTIFTDDSEGYWPYSGTEKLKVGGHLLDNGFPIGGMLLYRSQGINVNGALDLFGKKQFLAYWFGWYNGGIRRVTGIPPVMIIFILGLWPSTSFRARTRVALSALAPLTTISCRGITVTTPSRPWPWCFRDSGPRIGGLFTTPITERP